MAMTKLAPDRMKALELRIGKLKGSRSVLAIFVQSAMRLASEVKCRPEFPVAKVCIWSNADSASLPRNEWAAKSSLGINGDSYRLPMSLQASRATRRPRTGQFHNWLADAELGLGNLDTAIDEASKAIDAGLS